VVVQAWWWRCGLCLDQGEALTAICCEFIRAEHSVRVHHWLTNVFCQHPDQKEGQGLAVFDRSNEGLKTIRKKNEFGGYT
jgi:hypothetical protein